MLSLLCSNLKDYNSIVELIIYVQRNFIFSCNKYDEPLCEFEVGCDMLMYIMFDRDGICYLILRDIQN